MKGKGSRSYLSERPSGYIYGLRPKDSDQYFYIGSTTQSDLSHRLRGHFQRNHRNTALKFKVQGLGKSGVVIELIEKVPTKQRFEREYEVIAEYKAKGHPLLNMVLANEPPVWVKTPNRILRDLVILLENCTPNDSWVSWYCGIQVRNLKLEYADRGSTSPELFARIHALKDFPDREMPTVRDVLEPLDELAEAGKFKAWFKMYRATCLLLNISPKLGNSNVAA